MRGIRLRGGAGDRGARIGDQAFQQGDRPRRGGHELARLLSQPQGKLQHVEACFRLPPFGQLVAPGGVELRPAQGFRLLGGERLRHRAVRPFQQPARGDPGRPLRARRDPQQARCALDHHLAHVVLACADQRDAAMPAGREGRRRMRQRPHPFGTEPGLAGAAPAEHQPGGPGPPFAVLAGGS